MRVRRCLSSIVGGALLITMSGTAAMAARPPGSGPDPVARPGVAPGADAPITRRDPVTGSIESITAARVGLSKPSAESPGDVALAYTRAHAKDFGVSPGHAKSLYVAKELTLTTGATAVHLGQRVDGMRVRGADLVVVVATDGSVRSAAGHLVTGAAGGASATSTLTARQALDAAAARQGARAHRKLTEAEVRTAAKRVFPNVYGVGSAADRPVTTELVWHSSDHGRRIQLAWAADIESSGEDWWETVVDAQTGAVLDRTSRYADAGPEGTVWTGQHPEAAGATTRVVTPFTGLDGSWVKDRTTSGNNVNAYLDRNEDNLNNEYQPETPASTDSNYQHFNYTFADAWRTTANVDSAAALDTDRDVDVTQLF